MKKIKHYTGKSLDFYIDMRESKRNEQLKASLLSIHKQIEDAYKSYDDAFNGLQLHTLVPDTSLTNSQREQLDSLYDYSAVPIKHLWNELTTNEYNQKDTTCPFCEIDSAHTFDHVLPQSIFEEYAVHPLNLIPSCSTCNGYKGDEWQNPHALKFLNLYQDDLPDIQYLFVDLSVVSGVIKSRFYVANQGNINAALYERIEYTYTKMHLCERFQERCFNEIMELSNSVQTYLENGLTPYVIKNIIQTNVMGLRKLYGYNYWVAILKETCCKDTNAFQCLSTMK